MSGSDVRRKQSKNKDLTPVNHPEKLLSSSTGPAKDISRAQSHLTVVKQSLIPTPTTGSTKNEEIYSIKNENPKPVAQTHDHPENKSSESCCLCLSNRIKFLEADNKKQKKEIGNLKKDVQQYRDANENNYKEVVSKYNDTEKRCKSIEERLSIIEQKLEDLDDDPKNIKEMVKDIGQGYVHFREDFDKQSKQTSSGIANLTKVISNLADKVDNLHTKKPTEDHKTLETVPKSQDQPLTETQRVPSGKKRKRKLTFVDKRKFKTQCMV